MNEKIILCNAIKIKVSDVNSNLPILGINTFTQKYIKI